MQTNDSETVKEVTSKAFKCLPDIKQAINELTKLKAVGPATASGIKQLFENVLMTRAQEGPLWSSGMSKFSCWARNFLTQWTRV